MIQRLRGVRTTSVGNKRDGFEEGFMLLYSFIRCVCVVHGSQWAAVDES